MSFDSVVLGRTGVDVTRLGIGSAYGTDRSMVEAAVERGVNYLYWGALRTERMAAGIRSVANGNRDKLVVAVQTMSRREASITKVVERNLKTLGVDYIDVLILGMVTRQLNPRLVEHVQKLKERKLVRFLAVTSHKRKLFPELEKDKTVDIYHVRYNAAHRGAEEEVFPCLPKENGPGMVAFTASRWTGLINPRNLPSELPRPTPAACYRFALSNPNVHVAITAPNSMKQLMENLKALEEGPMSEEELLQMRRIGDHVYQSSQVVDQLRCYLNIRLWGKS